jgi:hypothetical protein
MGMVLAVDIAPALPGTREDRGSVTLARDCFPGHPAEGRDQSSSEDAGFYCAPLRQTP